MAWYVATPPQAHDLALLRVQATVSSGLSRRSPLVTTAVYHYMLWSGGPLYPGLEAPTMTPQRGSRRWSWRRYKLVRTDTYRVPETYGTAYQFVRPPVRPFPGGTPRHIPSVSTLSVILVRYAYRYVPTPKCPWYGLVRPLTTWGVTDRGTVPSPVRGGDDDFNPPPGCGAVGR